MVTISHVIVLFYFDCIIIVTVHPNAPIFYDSDIKKPVDMGENSASIGFFGVYDGHNGDYVAEILQASLSLEFQKNICNSCLEVQSSNHIISSSTICTKKGFTMSGGNATSLISSCLLDAVALVERQIVQIDVDRQKKLLLSNKEGKDNGGMADTQSFAGSVAVMLSVFPVAIREDNVITQRLQLLIAHVGDCRAVLSNAGVAMALTTDHKPDDPSEKKRIEIAGGFVHKSR